MSFIQAFHMTGTVISSILIVIDISAIFIRYFTLNVKIFWLFGLEINGENIDFCGQKTQYLKNSSIEQSDGGDTQGDLYSERQEHKIKNYFSLKCMRAFFLTMILLSFNIFVLFVGTLKVIQVSQSDSTIKHFPKKCSQTYENCIRLAQYNCNGISLSDLQSEANMSMIFEYLGTIPKKNEAKPPKNIETQLADQSPLYDFSVARAINKQIVKCLERIQQTKFIYSSFDLDKQSDNILQLEYHLTLSSYWLGFISDYLIKIKPLSQSNINLSIIEVQSQQRFDMDLKEQQIKMTEVVYKCFAKQDVFQNCQDNNIIQNNPVCQNSSKPIDKTSVKESQEQLVQYLQE
ncbi:UNKNOWN [Stylonychia lemnae]|uniref:Transmembrane protein n=1 Tax=Stylonychia lemnae TaxID=5949 RepID=A0A078AKU5_STYLE|nr:UNKNOWN [Stylonychia lemnae]|eukprot:CDW82511.1 UNKNOWN [Stylonychia lemnae]